MLKRYMFLGYSDDKNFVSNNSEGIERLSVHACDNKIIMYFESENESINPDDVVSGNLKPFPDGSHWMRMGEIYHSSKPLSREHWERKIADKTPYVQIMYLKDDKIGSYVFNHYRYQEELPGDGDKYGVIFLLGNFMAFYLENPCEIDLLAKGTLKTADTPYQDWGNIMNEHFKPWGNEEKVFWKKIERVL